MDITQSNGAYKAFGYFFIAKHPMVNVLAILAFI
jgi:hypothetical protein